MQFLLIRYEDIRSVSRDTGTACSRRKMNSYKYDCKERCNLTSKFIRSTDIIQQQKNLFQKE